MVVEDHEVLCLLQPSVGIFYGIMIDLRPPIEDGRQKLLHLMNAPVVQVSKLV